MSDKNQEQPAAEQPIKPNWKRNEDGLIEGIEYKYTPDGRIDWRAMVPKEYLVVNKQNFKNRTVPDSIDGLEDKDLLILLGGIKYLAALRGYTSVNHEVTFRDAYSVGVKTTINWIGNFETDRRETVFCSLADASRDNTSNFAQVYLSATAENRGFVRAVRNSLGIHICGKDEVGDGRVAPAETQEENASNGARGLLASTLSNNSISFDVFQNRMIVLENGGKDFAKGASEWKSISDVDESNIFAIISFINEGLAKKKGKESKQA